VMEILPGDVAQMMLKMTATPERLALIREELGLYRPVHVRYLDWLGSALQGDFGDSYYIKRPIAEILPPRIFHSLVLAMFALVFGIPVAILSGVWAGIRPDSLWDRVVSTISLIGISLPEFVTGVLLMFLLASTLHILPPSSSMMSGETPLSRPEILIMPAITLTGVLFAYIMRMTRASVIEVMQSQYVRTAILKGIPLRRVIFRHVLPNAMLPTITIIAQNFGWMLGGLIIVENVFAYPGLGKMLLTAMRTQDVPLLEAIALIVCTTYVFSNLVADLTYAALDPRIRLS
ncbi:ABC transporter permease, partial [Dehalococcoidia bacterium]|nr:ABC transporter permease [Dehalococcoidia bacterium]